MPISIKDKRHRALRRSRRVRARLNGTAQMPRLTVKRTKKHIYAQLIDDVAGRTLAASSDADVSAKGGSASGGKTLKPVETAREVGKTLGQRAKEKGIAAVVFDRGAYRYHGRVAALADGARESGLTF